MDDNRSERCETCRFWDKDSDTGAAGLCRRHAPVPLMVFEEDDEEPNFARWPLYPRTVDSEWCGEWQPKQPPESAN